MPHQHSRMTFGALHPHIDLANIHDVPMSPPTLGDSRTTHMTPHPLSTLKDDPWCPPSPF